MKKKSFLNKLHPLLAALAVVALSCFSAQAEKPIVQPVLERLAASEEVPQQLRGLDLFNEAWTGDFDKMLENRRIRIFVPQSRTLYFNDKGRERGIIGDTVRDFEQYLNKKYSQKIGRRPLTFFIIPHTRDILLTDIVGGLGDIAAGDITVTEERLKMVNFVSPADLPSISEVLVTRVTSPAVHVIGDLAGKTVHVRKASSYYESLTELNGRFAKENKKPIDIILVPDALEDEDLLEMLNAGIFDFLVIDDWMAKLWAQVLPEVTVREDIVFRSRGHIGWAIRKDNPLLEAEIREFYQNFLKKRGIIESRLTQYHKGIKKLKDPTKTAEWKRFEKTIDLFKKYGQQYGFDPIMLAAQGYQESTLDQSKRSPAGAIGIMQIMPKTGAALKVGNIKVTEPNIHAGAKYMDILMTSYFSDANFSEQDRSLFAFASYNAGPGKISKLRDLAQKRGLDPNRWFNNVELVTAEKVGCQTTTYVRNIYKYYIAYKLTLKAVKEKSKIREQLAAEK
jgi:membrane-bound lytic murein transglycosylase MltF